MTQRTGSEVKERVQPLITDNQVAQYLRNNLNFFEKNPAVLADLQVSHASGSAVSLIEKQVSVLRDENRHLRSRIRELVEIARENDALMSRLHSLSVALIDSNHLDQFLDTICERLRIDFRAERVSVRIITDEETDRRELVKLDEPALELFESILARGKPVCGRFNRQQLQFLFDERLDDIGSVALVPLGDIKPLGMFAIASTEKDRFSAGMSTQFLSYLGDIAGAALRRLL